MSIELKTTKGVNDNIVIDRFSVSFPSEQGIVQALNNVTLTFPANKITGIVGESGSGKSVLGMSLIRLNPSNALVHGSISLGTIDVCQLKKKSLRKLRRSQIALIPQNPSASLNPVLSIQKQIGEGLDQKRKTRNRNMVQDMLARLDLSEKGKLQPFQLSGGMKQRALIAMGIIRQPSWLLADEPTKGLDGRLRYQICSLLQEIYQQTSFGTILITHDLVFAAHLCHKIAVLYCGRIVEAGASSCIFSAPVHPYTQALLKAQPHKGLTPIAGTAATVSAPPVGCPFHPRCIRKQAICTQHFPEVRRMEDGREVYCHYA